MLMKRKLILIFVLVALVAFFGGSWLAGSALSASANRPIGNLPSDLAGRPVQFPSASGATIHGWFIPGKKGAGAIILMHGVRASRLSMLDRARFLSHEDYSVLLFDFQAHGYRTGSSVWHQVRVLKVVEVRWLSASRIRRLPKLRTPG